MTDTTHPSAYYQTFLVPWSESPSALETMYRNAGFIRTIASVFPAQLLADFATGALKQKLVTAFELQSAPNSSAKLSVGAKALCKHYVRTDRLKKDNSKELDPMEEKKERGHNNDFDHPFWKRPTGSDIAKNEIALDHLTELLAVFQETDAQACWKNVHQIHPNDTTIIEIRNTVNYYGMRWTVIFENPRESKEDVSGPYRLEFRGFLEP
ncbi:hypothetical protein BDR26DRAFT_894057 [Obelidium mucronatum]|nr:hypothetical protein BDR26DRAFT_894057 [Obelidium mucronatum]